MKLLLPFILILFVKVAVGQVSPLLSTTWNQGCNYNADCPTTGSGGACGRVWTGCNATAIAQIFKYYNYPASGMGDHCNTNNVSHCVDFSAQTYNYALMPNNVSSANPEVAKLMYHLGIAVDMQWSGSSSNSFFASMPLKQYFKYSPQMYSTSIFMFPTTEELVEALKNEMDNGRPVYAKGGSHFYLIDGYNSTDQFHMNFGWGGVYDGYYSINNVVNGAGTFTPVNFIFNIRPLDGTQEAANDTIYVSASANFNLVFEFTSLSDWTLTSTADWLIPSLNSGNSGYFAFSNGSTFNTTLNNGDERIAYLILENQDEIDTVVVVQAASPLQINPSNLEFEAVGGTESISLEYFSWGTWTASVSEPWLSLSSLSGTGPASLNLTCAENVLTESRSGYIAFAAGAYSDTVFVQQNGLEVNYLNELSGGEFYCYPNPADEYLRLVVNSKELSEMEFRIFNSIGREVVVEMRLIDENSFEMDISGLSPGVYFIGGNFKIGRVQRFIKN